MNRPEKPSVIEIERGGKTYRGSYRVRRGILTVTTLYGEKSTQVGGLAPEALARIPLLELVDAGDTT